MSEQDEKEGLEPEPGPAGERGAQQGPSDEPGMGAIIASVAPALVVLLLGVGLWWYLAGRGEEEPKSAPDAGRPAAAKEVDPIEALRSVRDDGGHDIDKTIRVMLELESLLDESSSLAEYIARARRLDYEGVAPRVLAVRDAVLSTVADIEHIRSEHGAHDASWDWVRTALSAVRAVRFGISSDSSGEARLDIGLKDEEIARVADEYTQRLETKAKLQREMGAARERLTRVLAIYSGFAHQYVKSWDALCVQRDLAYLAADEGHWDKAIEHARNAVSAAPHETEAHLVLALALIEKAGRRSSSEAIELPAGDEHPAPAGEAQPDAAALLSEAERVLDGYLAEHAEKSAPALLLKGVLQGQRGQLEDARTTLLAASADYPKQAARLEEMLGPYRYRQKYLQRSRAGLHVMEFYEATLQGAGIFSSNLQLARLHFARGDFDAGRAEIMRHFSRRRAQGSWSFVLSDIRYCYGHFGADFRRIFPAESFLDLLPGKTMMGFGGGFKVAVRNRSDRDVQNATLVLCLRFTDMHPEDYATFPLETRPVLRAGEVTDFGELELPPGFAVAGRPKTFEDLISDSTRAVLISDSAVIWVDTDAFRKSQMRERRSDVRPGPRLELGWLRQSPDELKTGLLASARLELALGLGDDEIVAKLPGELAILRPVFRLRLEPEALLEPESVHMAKGVILARFDAKTNLDPLAARKNLVSLLVQSAQADLRLDFALNQKGGYDLVLVERVE
ncbi:MAG: hypothetical protein JXR96_14220 [Deltaproteobacteria bacterium]|nr:hypothetical protein [Deltaproteobacteria bacterium]